MQSMLSVDFKDRTEIISFSVAQMPIEGSRIRGGSPIEQEQIWRATR